MSKISWKSTINIARSALPLPIKVWIHLPVLLYKNASNKNGSCLHIAINTYCSNFTRVFLFVAEAAKYCFYSRNIFSESTGSETLILPLILLDYHSFRIGIETIELHKVKKMVLFPMMDLHQFRYIPHIKYLMKFLGFKRFSHFGLNFDCAVRLVFPRRWNFNGLCSFEATTVALSPWSKVTFFTV